MTSIPPTSVPPPLSCATAADYALFIMNRALIGGESMEQEWLVRLRQRLTERQVDLDEILRLIVDETTRQLRADRGTLYLIDHARQEVVSRFAHLPEIQEIRLRLGEGVAGRVASTGEQVLLPREPLGEPFSPRVDHLTGYRTRSMMAVPIRSQGRIIGVLQLLNRLDGIFTEEDVTKLYTLSNQIAALLESSSLRSQLLASPSQPLSFRFNHIVGESAAMQQVYERTARAAQTDATVLIRGESGSGKELIARAVHFNSQRRDQPFVVVDCAALPSELIENELFGHERGAYTSADRASSGKVESAEGGTLFIDEVGELPLPTQARLLRLVQERTYSRVGSSQRRQANVRFVFATHRNLEDLIESGKFRTDLYYRMRVVQIEIPPLRVRGHGDLDRLIDHFLFEFTRRHGRASLRLADRARAALHGHDWPGNVRELQHCIESAVVLCPGEEITADQLPISTPQPLRAEDGEVFQAGMMSLRELERDYIQHVLGQVDGNRSAAARILGIGRNTLLRKLTDS
jgi:Nif-specific regulatory protein